MPQNKILTAANAALPVTNLTAMGGTTATMEGVPIGTPADSATGELAVKVRLVAGGVVPPPSGGTFTSNVALATSSGNIPVGSFGWSATAISGTITVGGASLPVGASVGGGGYTGYTLGTQVAYTVSSGSVLIVYDN